VLDPRANSPWAGKLVCRPEHAQEGKR
jgi:hypothetical protein